MLSYTRTYLQDNIFREYLIVRECLHQLHGEECVFLYPHSIQICSPSHIPSVDFDLRNGNPLLAGEDSRDLTQDTIMFPPLYLILVNILSTNSSSVMDS